MTLKDKILEELENNIDTYVSGQVLAQKFGVSRNAVWKAINQIKNDGCKIASVNNKGYRLISLNDALSAERIYENLSPEHRAIEVIVLKSVDSTNNEAKRMTANGYQKNAVVVANEQTKGRGRLGRSFYSPKNTGVYMSFLLSTNTRITDAVLITTAAAVAVVRAIERLTSANPMIKWVNDVYLGDRKICGILTEAVTDIESSSVQSLIIGIGVNISTEDFPSEIQSTAGSLGINGLSRNKLIAAITDELTDICANFEDRSYLKTYRDHSLIIGKSIDYFKNNVKYNAIAVDIDNNGGLIVKLPNGRTEVLSSGEVTVRLH